MQHMQLSELKYERSAAVLPGKETYCHKGLLCWSLAIATGESLETFGVGCWQDVLFQQDNAPAQSMAGPAHTSYSSALVAPDYRVYWGEKIRGYHFDSNVDAISAAEDISLYK